MAKPSPQRSDPSAPVHRIVIPYDGLGRWPSLDFVHFGDSSVTSPKPVLRTVIVSDGIAASTDGTSAIRTISIKATQPNIISHRQVSCKGLGVASRPCGRIPNERITSGGPKSNLTKPQSSTDTIH